MKLTNIKILLVMISLFACVADNEEQELTPLHYIDKGWSHFEAAEYPEALQDFSSAKDGAEMMLDTPTTLLAQSGLGWSNIMLGELSAADESFYISYAHQNNDVLAGQAFVFHELSAYLLSNQRIGSVLSDDPDWSFSHLENVNSDDLLLLRAYNYILDNKFFEAFTVFKLIDQNFTANIETQVGQQALLDAIEAMNPGISGFTN